MRENKFRFWDGEKMHHNVSVGGFPDTVPTVWDEFQAEWVHLQPVEGMTAELQFTGLKDSKGKEIYEFCEINNKFVIIWHFNRYILKNMLSGDIIEIKKGGTYEITREFVEKYSEIPKNKERNIN